MAIKELPSQGIAELLWFSVPGMCELSLSTLKERLEEKDLIKFMPRARVESDAVRLAFAYVAKESFKKLDSGGSSQLVITGIPKKTDDSTQRWAVYRQIKDVDDQQVEYDLVGYASLDGSGAMSLPGGIEISNKEFRKIVKHFVNTADCTKLRSCLETILASISKIKFDNSPVYVVLPTNAEKLKKVAEVFEDLDEGRIDISIYSLTGTKKNMENLKEDIERSVGKELTAIMEAILTARKEETHVPKGKFKEWIDTLTNLKENMSLMKMLEVKLPHSIGKVQMQIAELQEELEADKPVKKETKFRKIGTMKKMTLVEDD